MKGTLFRRRNRCLVLAGSTALLSTFILFVIILTSDFLNDLDSNREKRDLISLSPSSAACPAILLCNNGTMQFECTNDSPCEARNQVCCLCFDGQKTRCSDKVANVTTTPHYAPTTLNYTVTAINGSTLNYTTLSSNFSSTTPNPSFNGTTFNGTVTVSSTVSGSGNNTNTTLAASSTAAGAQSSTTTRPSG